MWVENNAKNKQKGRAKKAASTSASAIYAYLLNTTHARSPRPFEYQPWVQDGFLRLQATSPPFQICTEVLRVNKQIYHESVNTLYASNMFVRLSLYNDDVHWTHSLLEGTELGFVCSNPTLVAKLKGHALDVRLIQEKSKILRCQVVFPAIFLPRFLNFLQTMCDALPKWGREHAIHLHLRQKYHTSPMATESLLLEPWRSLHGIQSVVVGTSIVIPDYANGLRTSMMTRFHPDKWLQSLVKLKDIAIQDFAKGHSQDALNHFVHITALLESVFKSSHGHTLVSQSPQFNHAISKLRYECELHLAKCSLKRRKAPWEEAFGINSQWKEALLAVWRAVALAEDNNTYKVWAACAPWIPANDKSGYSAEDRRNARFCSGSILSELGFVNYYHLSLYILSPPTFPEQLCFFHRTVAALDDVHGDIVIQNALEKAKENRDPTIRPGAVLRKLGIFV
ncbi:MAG: hypothetical protein L6R36_007542 [Xanthoria steineri]|nr:MAG: hypothetical protein L6R36_007542 [Xanthoria steineri]